MDKILDSVYFVADDPVRISPRFANLRAWAELCDEPVCGVTYYGLMRHIERAYGLASEIERRDGIAWYPLIRETCLQLAHEFRVPEKTVAYILAALSPRVHWLHNLDATRAILQGDQDFRYAGFSRQWRIAHQCHAEGVLPGGPKVKRFAENILGNRDVVTVDSHAVSVALDLRIENQNLTSFAESVYLTIESAYLQSAKRLGLLGYELQAITWIYWRNLHNVAWNKESAFYAQQSGNSDCPF